MRLELALGVLFLASGLVGRCTARRPNGWVAGILGAVYCSTFMLKNPLQVAVTPHGSGAMG